MGSSTANSKDNKKKKKPPKPEISVDVCNLATAVVSSHGVAADAYPAWQQYLSQRKVPQPLARLLKSDRSPVLWGVAQHHLADASSRDFIAHLAAIVRDQDKLTPATIEDWCRISATRQDLGALGLESVALAGALPKLAGQLELHAWQCLLETLIQLARDSRAWSKPGTPWPAQLLGGELPLALAYHLPEVEACHELASDAALFISESIDNLLDGSGCPEAPLLGLARPLLACWVRCLTMLGGIRKVKLAKSARADIDWLVRHTLRLTRQDGSQVFGPRGELNDDFAQLISAANRWFDDDHDTALAQLVLTGADVSADRLPEDPGYESEWAGVAVLQPEWMPSEPRLATIFREDIVHVELATQGQTISSGPWISQVNVDGMPLSIQGEWGSVCWFSDFDVDYLELEADLTNGWKIQRQFLMARQDYFLYTADILVGPSSGQIEYRLRIPLQPGITFDSAHETNEGYLSSDTTLALVVPLAAPEWRNDLRDGKLEAGEGFLELRHATNAQRLYAPLFIDLHKRRQRKENTWRQLTVGESLETVTPDVAAGFRIHVGPEQWLAYRSLAKPGNRTVLGQNVISEFLLARFLTNGDIEPIVEIE